MIVILLLVFSIITPIGVVIGLFVTGTNQLLEVFFHATSGGTFIYVACSEIIV